MDFLDKVVVNLPLVLVGIGIAVWFCENVLKQKWTKVDSNGEPILGYRFWLWAKPENGAAFDDGDEPATMTYGSVTKTEIKKFANVDRKKRTFQTVTTYP